jgi:AcrR family transcriptional regulator
MVAAPGRGACFESNSRSTFVPKEVGMAARTDRRVLRTRQLLQGALLALIREKGFEALSVQDIIDRANVGRATFYAHFDNKEDLLVSGIEGLRTALKEVQGKALAHATRTEERVFAFSRELFEHVEGHRDVFQAMVGKRSGTVIRQMFHKMLLDLVRGDVRTTAGAKSAAGEARAQFIAGGLFGIVIWWIDAPKRPAVDDVDRLFRRLALPALAVSLGEAPGRLRSNAQGPL